MINEKQKINDNVSIKLIKNDGTIKQINAEKRNNLYEQIKSRFSFWIRTGLNPNSKD